MELEYKSYAKINLALDVTGKRDDGYHNIRTIFQEIDLYDTVYVMAEEGNSCTISCDNKLVPLGEDNIMYKAWLLLKDYYPHDKGVRVHINKNIPIAAGLAGGSSNGATMIKALVDLWQLNLDDDEIFSIASRLGADVPYFFMGSTVLGEGKGEELQRLRSFKDRHILLVNIGVGVSTEYVYKHIRVNDDRINIEDIILGLEEDDDKKIYPNLINKLEEVTISLEPEIEKVKASMMAFGADATLMCGSGPTVFGIFSDTKARERAFFYFKDKFELVFQCETR